MKKLPRKRALASIALPLIGLPIFAMTSTSPASAEPSPAPTSLAENFKNPQERYKFERDAYLIAVKVRVQQIKNINIVFKNACDKASLDFKNAMSIARTPDQKNFASALRKNAISSAILARDLAIESLGDEPIAPIEPPKQMKSKKRN